MSKRNYYQILGLSPGADQERIKAAFRGLAKSTHPDVNLGDLAAERRFKEISRAYRVLSDPEARAVYDLDLQREGDLARLRFRQSVSTMVVTCVLTCGVGVTAALWIQNTTFNRAGGGQPAQLPDNWVAAPNKTSKSINEQSAFADKPAMSQLPGSFGHTKLEDLHSPSIITSTPREQIPDESNVPSVAAPPATAYQEKIASGEVSEPGKDSKMPQRVPLVAAPIDVPQRGTARPWGQRPAGTERTLASWTTYRNARFGFALKYPADMFVLETAPADNGAGTFVSRDGRVVLQIRATENGPGDTLEEHRRLLMEQRYGGATYDYTPQHSHWFVLSGTRGEEMFYERVSFSCDGRSIHGWRLTYPVAERAFYDRIIEEIHGSYRYRNGSGARCSEAKRETTRPLTPFSPKVFAR